MLFSKLIGLAETTNFQTAKCMSSIDIENTFIKVIGSFNISKPCGFDEISTLMLIMCNSAISKTPLIIFERCLA